MKRHTKHSRPLRRPQAGTARAFTLIELLVVIGIISLLLTIMVPTVSSVLAQGDAAKTSAILASLQNGAEMYHKNYHYYPGQQYTGQLAGSSGSYTGSQVLGAAMYGYTYGDIADSTADDDATEVYAPFKADLLGQGDGGPDFSLLDGFPEPMAMLYYPARLGESGTSQYKLGDNSTYGSGAEVQADMTAAITDSRTGGAVRPGKYLLLGAGPDREYFTSDDRKNW